MEIRETLDKDIDGIRELFKICFNKELSREEWEWKYRRSPWGSYSVVAVDGDNVVAHYGGIRNKFYLDGKTLYAYQFCDVMTHPRYRAYPFSKRPLTAQLNEMFYRERQMDFAYGFPSIRHTRLQCIRLGGEGYGYVRLYKKAFIKDRARLWGLGFKVGWGLLEDDTIDRFITNHDGTLQLVKDKGYIRWRYKENPRGDYTLGVSKRWGMTKGVVIFTLRDNWLNLLDLFLMDKDDIVNVIPSLEKHAINTYRHINGIRGWFHPKEPIIGHLMALGYNYEDDIPYAYRTLNKGCGITVEIFLENYFYRMGDYDAA
ncbi:MAG: hypothetical protein Fur0020_11410 [Thermodesulfovibrionia bacterium]